MGDGAIRPGDPNRGARLFEDPQRMLEPRERARTSGVQSVSGWNAEQDWVEQHPTSLDPFGLSSSPFLSPPRFRLVNADPFDVGAPPVSAVVVANAKPDDVGRLEMIRALTDAGLPIEDACTLVDRGVTA